MQARDGTEDRGEDQRHDDHLQQLYVAVTDQIKPTDGGFQHAAVVAIYGMQGRAEQHAEHEGQQDFFRQAPVGTAGLQQAHQQRQKYQQVEDQGQIHESSKIRAGASMGAVC